MRGDEGEPGKADAASNSETFRCLACGQVSRRGADACEGCGTRYVWTDIDADACDRAEYASSADIDGFTPIVEEGSVDCGYFDVAGGTLSFTGPSCPNRYELSECQNCATMIEVPVKCCPLCGGRTKKIVGGLGAVLSGAIAWGTFNRESRANIFCQSCGEMVAARNGRCELCDGDIVPQSENLSNPILRPLSAESVVFVHMNFESGRVSYLTERDRAEAIKAEAGTLGETPSAVDIDTFGRIGMMFDEQTSTILDIISKSSMTASEICGKLRIPRSVCYRKLKTLTDAKILQLDRAGPESGGWHASRYSSNVDMAYVAFEHGEMRMMVRFKDSKEIQTQRFSSDIL